MLVCVMYIGMFACNNDKNFCVEECGVSQINVVSKEEFQMLILSPVRGAHGLGQPKLNQSLVYFGYGWICNLRLFNIWVRFGSGRMSKARHELGMTVLV